MYDGIVDSTPAGDTPMTTASRLRYIARGYWPCVKSTYIRIIRRQLTSMHIPLLMHAHLPMLLREFMQDNCLATRTPSEIKGTTFHGNNKWERIHTDSEWKIFSPHRS